MTWVPRDPSGRGRAGASAGGPSWRSRRLAALAGAWVALLVPAGCGGDGDGGGERATVPDYRAALQDAPPRLARLHQQANELLEGGPDAFQARLDDLEGHPVVVNKWASWCGPCRKEMPLLQREAARRGTEVAFLGVNASDAADSARSFLREFPVPYPSYLDPKLEISRRFDALVMPATAYYGPSGKLRHVHRGEYRSAAALARDLDRYAASTSREGEPSGAAS